MTRRTHSSDDKNASPPARKDVSAQRPPRPQSTSSPPDLRSSAAEPAPSRLSTVLPKKKRRLRPDSDGFATPAGRSKGHFSIVVDEPESDQPLQLSDLYSWKAFERSSGFLISFCAHLLMLIVLSLLILQSGVGDVLVELDFRSRPEPEGLLDIEVGASDSSGELELDEETNDFSEDEAIDLIAKIDESEIATNDFSKADGANSNENSSSSIGRSDVGITRGDSGSGSGAQFFGTKIKGNSIVYILDRSGSMEQGVNFSQSSSKKITRFEAAKRELMRSVNSLSEDQKFFVMVFSGSSKSMMNDRSRNPVPIAATRENKQKLATWLKNTDPYWEGTDPRQSLELAFRINPDSIYLLSDGEFKGAANDRSVGVMPLIRKQNVNQIQINTIALEDRSSLRNMVEVAEATGGENRFVSLDTYWDDSLEWSQETCLESLQFIMSDSPKWSIRLRRCHDFGIPLVQNIDPEVRETAQEFLHEMSFGLYKGKVPDVTKAKTNADLDEIAARWTEIWESAEKLRKRWKDVSPDPNTPIVDLLLVARVDPGAVNSLRPIRNYLFDTNRSQQDKLKVATSLMAIRHNSKTQPLRLRTKDDLTLISAITGEPGILGDWRERHRIAKELLIPILEEGNPKQRRDAEHALHNLSMRLFVHEIPSPPDTAGQNKIAELAALWRNAFNSVEIQRKQPVVNNSETVGQFDESLSDPVFGQMHERTNQQTDSPTQKVNPLNPADSFEFSVNLLARLQTQKRDAPLNDIVQLCKSKDLPFERQVLLAKAICDYQVQNGVSKQSHDALYHLLGKFDSSIRYKKFRPGNYPDALQSRNKLEAALAKRITESKRLYVLLTRLKKGSSRTLKTQEKLLEKYPETIYAEAVRKGVDVETLK